jgi:Fic family protein
VPAAAPPDKWGVAPWAAELQQCAEVLAATPRGQLNMNVLITLQLLLVPATNPHRGQVRDQRAFIWFDGVMRQELPGPRAATSMVAETLSDLEDAVASGATCLDPVGSASETAFRVLQAHPFMDGNGRVARALANWVLQNCGFHVIRDPRSYCRARDAAYYEALAIRQGVLPNSSDTDPWCAFFGDLVAECYQSAPDLDSTQAADGGVK